MDQPVSRKGRRLLEHRIFLNNILNLSILQLILQIDILLNEFLLKSDDTTLLDSQRLFQSVILSNEPGHPLDGLLVL